MASFELPSYPVILEDTFGIVVSKQIATECRVTLHHKGLYIEPLPNTSNGPNNSEHSKIIKINNNDVVGCEVFEDFQQLLAGKKKTIVCIPAKNKKGKVEPEKCEESEDKCVYFCVYSYPLKFRLRGLGRAKVRQPQFYKMKVEKYENKEENLNLANKWQNAIQWISRGRLLVSY